MPTVKRSDSGPQIKSASGPIRVSQPQVMDAPPAGVAESAGPEFIEKCEVLKAPTPDPVDKLIEGMEWTPLDVDRDGNAMVYLCENRAMKIAANLRREKGEALTPKTEWLLFRMNQLIFRSTNQDEVFEFASKS